MDKETERGLQTFRQWVTDTRPGGMVFFGGAGVSTESGIPDFRSPNGLYAQKYPHPPEQMISRSFFDAHPAEFFDFYCDRMLALDAEPNRAHQKLAELEGNGTLSAVVTQNIDGLHQKAGSKHVYELHGSVLRNHCTRCGKAYGVERIVSSAGVPRCSCGGVIKPDVVLYEEPLDEDVMARALHYIRQADVLLIGGTSLVVYPAAGLITYYRGHKLAVVNKGGAGPAQAAVTVDGPIGQVLEQL